MLTVFAFQRLGARVSAEGQASSEGEDGTCLGSELGGLRTGSQADPSPTPLIPSGRTARGHVPLQQVCRRARGGLWRTNPGRRRGLRVGLYEWPTGVDFRAEPEEQKEPGPLPQTCRSCWVNTAPTGYILILDLS